MSYYIDSQGNFVPTISTPDGTTIDINTYDALKNIGGNDAVYDYLNPSTPTTNDPPSTDPVPSDDDKSSLTSDPVINKTLSDKFNEYLATISQNNSPIVQTKPLPPQLTKCQLLYIKEDFELGWNISHFPIEQQLEILRSIQSDFRQQLIFQETRRRNNGNKSQNSKNIQRSKRNSSLQRITKSSKRGPASSFLTDDFNQEIIEGW